MQSLVQILNQLQSRYSQVTSLVHQEQSLIQALSVAENLFLDKPAGSTWGGVYRWNSLRDRANVALGFAALAFLGLQVGARRPLVTLVALAGLGLGIEAAQSLTGWRQGDWQDWAADLVGLALGWLALWAVRQASGRLAMRRS